MAKKRAQPEGPPALAVIEVGSIARGLTTVDALVKRAEVRLLAADPVTPGKYIIVFGGPEEEVRESLDAALEGAGPDVVDSLYLPFVHRELLSALDGLEPPPVRGSLGTLEYRSVAATVLGADAALKAAAVSLVAIHLARGIGGRGYVVFTGSQDSVEAALEAGEGAVELEQRFARELIARPHPDMDWALGRLTRR
ncbi:MAG: BMC domain-containing protein [Polyangiales bacterium]|nr:BMC domain-containing protein [Myxococcales bacterium]